MDSAMLQKYAVQNRPNSIPISPHVSADSVGVAHASIKKKRANRIIFAKIGRLAWYERAGNVPKYADSGPEWCPARWKQV